MKYILSYILICFFTCQVSAQINRVLQTSSKEMNVNNSKMQASQNMAGENNIFIQQVGDHNNVNANVRSRQSEINYIQNGTNNYIDANVYAETYNSTIEQQGDNNNFFDQMYNSNTAASLQLKQEGNNLHFERFGSNSIGDNLQFRMTGDTRSIIVRNFK